MLKIGVQTKNVVFDENPREGFETLKRCGFDACDFSLNSYLLNTSLYQNEVNKFFDQSTEELCAYFAPHKEGAKAAGVAIHQMHMPYPIYIPTAKEEVNNYLWNHVAPKSMDICEFLECKYIVIHGLKLAYFLGSEEKEWEKTAEFLDYIAPRAKEMGATICMENLYTSTGNHIIEGPANDARKATRRIDEFNTRYGAEVLGFCFDTGHANLTGLDFESFITTLGDRLKVLHIHDNDGIYDLHQLPFTFTKTRENTTSTDWEGFIRGLRAIHFDKVLSFETAPVLTSFPDELKEDALQMISKIGRYFSEQISC